MTCYFCGSTDHDRLKCPEVFVSGSSVAPCPSCATFRAKLDREELAKVMDRLLDPRHKYDPQVFADAIIAYLKEG